MIALEGAKGHGLRPRPTAWRRWRRAPLFTRESSIGGRRRAEENGLICPQESPGSMNNGIEGHLVENAFRRERPHSISHNLCAGGRLPDAP
jgi:hypothetical protein